MFFFFWAESVKRTTNCISIHRLKKCVNDANQKKQKTRNPASALLHSVDRWWCIGAATQSGPIKVLAKTVETSAINAYTCKSRTVFVVIFHADDCFTHWLASNAWLVTVYGHRWRVVCCPHTRELIACACVVGCVRTRIIALHFDVCIWRLQFVHSMASLSTLYSAAMRNRCFYWYIYCGAVLWTDYIMCVLWPEPAPVKVTHIYASKRIAIDLCRLWARPRSNPLHSIKLVSASPTGFLSGFRAYGRRGDRLISMASEMCHACPTMHFGVFECNFSEMENYNNSNNMRKKLQPLLGAMHCTRVSAVLCFFSLFTCALFRRKM